jgi:cytochrome c biogenesis protein CcdA
MVVIRAVRLLVRRLVIGFTLAILPAPRSGPLLGRFWVLGVRSDNCLAFSPDPISNLPCLFQAVEVSFSVRLGAGGEAKLTRLSQAAVRLNVKVGIIAFVPTLGAHRHKDVIEHAYWLR